MTRKTVSEEIFEEFCASHSLVCRKIPHADTKTPDYELILGETVVCVEIKQIEAISGFSEQGVSSRTVGDQVRRQIESAREQMRAAADLELPTILLIYNAVDPWQVFGTEDHDFLTAMYGELTIRIRISDGAKAAPFHGRNAKFRKGAKLYFSAVGHLSSAAGDIRVRLFENVYAQNPLPFDAMPACFGLKRIELVAT